MGRRVRGEYYTRVILTMYVVLEREFEDIAILRRCDVMPKFKVTARTCVCWGELQ